MDESQQYVVLIRKCPVICQEVLTSYLLGCLVTHLPLRRGLWIRKLRQECLTVGHIYTYLHTTQCGVDGRV